MFPNDAAVRLGKDIRFSLKYLTCIATVALTTDRTNKKISRKVKYLQLVTLGNVREFT